MKEIQLYTDSPSCPKCESRMYASREHFKYCNGMHCKLLEPTYPGGMGPKYPPEHLHCTCPQCGYVELMECADAEPSPEEDGPPDFVLTCPHCAREIHRSISEVYNK